MSWVNAQLIRRKISSNIFSPLSLAPKMWLDGQDSSTVFTDTSETTPSTNGVVVGRWKDKSGFGFHADQATGGTKPLLNTSTLNSFQGLDFDGTKAMTSGGVLTGSTKFEIWCVSRSSTAIQVLFENYAGTTPNVYTLYRNTTPVDIGVFGPSSASSLLSSPAASTGCILVREYYDNVLTSNCAKLQLNGVNATSYTSNADASGVTVASGTTYIGRRYDASVPLIGALGEFVIFDKLLSAGEVTDLQSYLMTKWTI